MPKSETNPAAGINQGWTFVRHNWPILVALGFAVLSFVRMQLILEHHILADGHTATREAIKLQDQKITAMERKIYRLELINGFGGELGPLGLFGLTEPPEAP